MPAPSQKPPVFTLVSEILDWTLDRTAAFPRTQRSSLGRRLDDLAIEAVERALEAIYAPGAEKAGPLRALNLLFEKLRVFWRLAQRRGWISQPQLFFIAGKVDEAGHMAGAWLKSLRPA